MRAVPPRLGGGATPPARPLRPVGPDPGDAVHGHQSPSESRRTHAAMCVKGTTLAAGAESGRGQGPALGTEASPVCPLVAAHTCFALARLQAHARTGGRRGRNEGPDRARRPTASCSLDSGGAARGLVASRPGHRGARCLGRACRLFSGLALMALSGRPSHTGPRVNADRASGCPDGHGRPSGSGGKASEREGAPRRSTLRPVWQAADTR